MESVVTISLVTIVRVAVSLVNLISMPESRRWLCFVGVKAVDVMGIDGCLVKVGSLLFMDSLLGKFTVGFMLKAFYTYNQHIYPCVGKGTLGACNLQVHAIYTRFIPEKFDGNSS